MAKPPAKLPVNRRKPIGASITAADVAKIVKSAESRREPTDQSRQTKSRPKPVRPV